MPFYHAKLPLAESSRERAIELLRTLVENSREEDGVIEYHAAVDVTDSNIVHLIEEFEDQDAYDNHQQTDHVQEVEDVLPELLAGEPQMIQLEGADKSILDE